jgi:chromate transporter
VDEPTTQASLAELARYFVRLGCTAFGGPAAHIAIMEDDVVRRRRWLTRAHFMDMLAATQLVPGPNSTEMAIHIGYVQQGLPGLIVAGVCFILPAFLIVLGISIAYVIYGKLPTVGATALLPRNHAPNSTILIGIGALLGLLAQALAGRI